MQHINSYNLSISNKIPIKHAIKLNKRSCFSFIVCLKIICHAYGQVDCFDRHDDMEVVKIGVDVYPLVERNHIHPSFGSK